MGSPLELIKFNAQTGKFEVGATALATLRKVKGPIAVVAVCGRARQGKSFILNQLLQSSSGFQVGATHRPCTKGLWMWSTPQRINVPDGSSHHLVLLDTEGVDAYDQTAQYSTQIFSLAVLLSSLFVYNQMGGIDESALDRLGMVTEMTKHVRVRAAGASGGGDQGLGEHSPAFLWLLRDFYLKLEEEGGRKITPKEYLETALRLVPGTSAAVQSKNAIRTSISQLFPVRDCFTLVRPMVDEAALSQMDTLPRENLRPEFRQGVKDLMALIFQRAVPKRFGLQLMTGPVLAGLVEAYVSAINQGAVPTIATAWQGVAESECRRACDAAEAAYVANWKGGGEVSAEESELEARHQQSLEAARAAFGEIAVGDECIRKAHEARWMTAVASRYKDFRGCRLAEAAAAVNELLYKGANEVAKAVRGGADLLALQQIIASFVTSYEKAAAGPTKFQKLAAFLVETWPAAASQVLDRHAAAAEAAQKALQGEMAELRGKLSAENQRAEQAERHRRDMTNTAKSLHEQLNVAQQDAMRMRAALEQKSGAAAALQQELAGAQRDITQMQADMKQKSDAAAILQQQLAESKREIVQMREVLDQKSGAAATLQQQLTGTQEELVRLRTALKQESDASASFQQQLAEAQQDAARLRANLDQKTAKVAALEAQMSEVLVVSERKQASAVELADARVRAAQSEFQSKLSEMTVVLTAERARAESLAADLEGLAARCTSAEGRLAAQEAEASEWRSKYMREASLKLELQGQRDQARDSLQLVTVERDSVARERDAARAEAEQLRADLLAETHAKEALQAQMDGYMAEAQAARTQPVAAALYGGDNDENSNPSGEANRGRVIVDAGSIAKMSIQEIKDTLTQAGYQEEVWTLANRRPAAKKADWIAMLQSRSQASS
ncbi:hypothetical protein Vretimale_11947 [Volvox reticuliferus]|uniref:GB1/RHD3-type G domain-containing protein n=1 Tax=Volvox reticuliferus TaxID=1737510 RepID=A0A8J4CLH3_9CHLO|nr:hypothetical protein Vretifemale_11345 [Volvox reticuliferus]GIM07902.1 hypothetical protein Vretimale_11947 [Volvox reticuliferus]